jgi:hypothetical protein
MSDEGTSDLLPDIDVSYDESPEPVEETPEPVPVVEEPEVDPAWLEEPSQAPYPTSPQSQPQYNYPPPQYQPPPQNVPQGYMAPPPPPDAFLEQFLQSPNQVIQSQVQQQLNQFAGPMSSRILEMEAATKKFMEARTNDAVGVAKKSIGDGYKDVLNKDEAFRGNKNVRDRVENALKTMYNEAEAEARYTGNYSKLNSFSNPMLFDMTLIAAKKLAGYKATGSEGMGFGGGIESANPATQSVSQELTADEEAAVARLGKGGRQQYLDAIKKYGNRISFE